MCRYTVGVRGVKKTKRNGELQEWVKELFDIFLQPIISEIKCHAQHRACSLFLSSEKFAEGMLKATQSNTIIHNRKQIQGIRSRIPDATKQTL